MSYCLNPNCANPRNPAGTKFCLTCGSKVRLKERYRTVQPLGQGGFGRTFLAVDEDKPSHPPCVIKQFFPQAQGTSTVQKAAQLFTQEAVRLDELGKHPQIPELLAYFCQDNHQYLVQEFIEGEDLAQELAKKGAFTEAQVRDVLNNLLPVLLFVHQHHVIHRDIKPENIIRRNRDKQLFLVDFGASKVATGTALARTGTVIGSVGYVAPEQSIGKAVFASDIYSLGVMCIHLLTGIHPFDLFDVNQGVWVWRQGLKNPVSDRVAKILDKMLVSATNQRYQSVVEILQDLQSQTPVAKVKSVKPAPPPASAPMKSQPKSPQYEKGLDKELADLKSEFLQPPTSKSTPPKSIPPTKGSANTQKTKSQMDRELEDIKSQFLEE